MLSLTAYVDDKEEEDADIPTVNADSYYSVNADEANGDESHNFSHSFKVDGD